MPPVQTSALWKTFGFEYAPHIFFYGRRKDRDRAGDPDYLLVVDLTAKSQSRMAAFSFEPLPALSKGQLRPGWTKETKQVVVKRPAQEDAAVEALLSAVDRHFELGTPAAP